MTIEVLYWAIVTLLGAVTGLIIFIWQRIERRQQLAEDLLALKVGQQEFREFQTLVHSFRDSIHALDVQLAAIKEQIGRYNADIESEKRTRREANFELNRKLDKLLERREQDQHRKSDE